MGIESIITFKDVTFNDGNSGFYVSMVSNPFLKILLQNPYFNDLKYWDKKGEKSVLNHEGFKEFEKYFMNESYKKNINKIYELGFRIIALPKKEWETNYKPFYDKISDFIPFLDNEKKIALATANFGNEEYILLSGLSNFSKKDLPDKFEHKGLLYVFEDNKMIKDNAKAILNNQAYGITLSNRPTYIKSMGVEVGSNIYKEHVARFIIDAEKLIDKRNIFMDPESVLFGFIEKELGKTFIVLNKKKDEESGIPAESIIDIIT
jgi:hypothetical protein